MSTAAPRVAVRSVVMNAAYKAIIIAFMQHAPGIRWLCLKLVKSKRYGYDSLQIVTGLLQALVAQDG